MAFYDVFGKALVEEIINNNEWFNKDVARIIIDMISPHMQEGQRIAVIYKDLKILATLHFYGSGSYQLSSGQRYNFALSQPSMSRCIDEVTEVIYSHITPNWIKFPNSEHSRNTVSNGFRRKYNIPQCLGAIDCTHIAIISPPENYPTLPYYCRKGYYSINCQIIVVSPMAAFVILLQNNELPNWPVRKPETYLNTCKQRTGILVPDVEE
uniref:Nuclease HARBI1 n=1 Tax=Diabrotica virgifera virgifera TaxID=50390 RepID=A0A6P7H5M7_DIAVI